LLKIGLTGGIASGKSTASQILKRLGATVIDVDMIGREVVKKGSPYLREIVEYFGEGILLEDGTLDRKKLGSIVFKNRDKLKILNSIVHPPMIARIKSLLESMEREGELDKVVVDAAILIEMGLHRLVDVIWLVKIPRQLQIERLMLRDNISREKAENMINSQMPMEEKEKFAAVIIDNSGTIEELEKSIEKHWRSI
jgi:dephospho-CoA kinase